ncbi:MAG TPA: hypothetical protein VM008_09040 [Phycisphaerae bacterium]|nr:hypothetical protein [Phycisphaerae bacterium]
MNKSNAAELRKNGTNGGLVLLGMIVGLLLLQAILRVCVAVALLTAPGIEGQFGALVHWRIYDSVDGWVGVLLLAMAGASERSRRAEWIVLGAGLLGMIAAMMLGDVGGRAIVEIAVAAVLALGAALMAGRQLIGLSRAAGKIGLDLEQLWRGVALQWTLLWITAELALRIKFWRDGVEAEPRARLILFLVPTVGVLPNVMMAMGVRWWNALRGSPEKRPRVRAWLVSMGAVNVGALLAGASVWRPALAIAGATLMIAGIGLYFVGFPRGAWRAGGGGWLVMASFATLVIGLGMMAADDAVQRDFYSAAWRHLLSGAIVPWLIGIGMIAMQTMVSDRLRPHGAAIVSACMVLIGLFSAAGVFVAAVQDRSVVQGLFVGAVLQLLGIIVGGAALLRASRGRYAAPVPSSGR